MYLDSAKKQELFEKYGKSATNTGSAESQIRIVHIPYLSLDRALESESQRLRYGKIIEDVGR